MEGHTTASGEMAVQLSRAEVDNLKVLVAILERNFLMYADSVQESIIQAKKTLAEK